MKTNDTVNARLRLPADLYRRLRHAAIDRDVTVNELLLRAVQLVAEEAPEPREQRP